MKKTYNCNSRADVKAAIARIIMAKIKENAGARKININIRGNVDE